MTLYEGPIFRVERRDDRDVVVHAPVAAVVAVDGDDRLTLVRQRRVPVDTSLLDASGMPHSEDLQIIERYHLEKGGSTLVGELTFEDPKTFSSPWTTRVTYRKLPPGTELDEDVCRERIAKGLPAFELDKWK